MKSAHFSTLCIRMGKSLLPRLSLLLMCALSLSVWATTTPPDSPECETDKDIPNKAMHCPDQFAWEVFITLNQPLDGGKVPTWHSFATDQDTFPQKPVPSVCNSAQAGAGYCPQWPEAGRALAIEQQGPSKSSHLPIDSMLVPFLTNVELVQRNKASFDYIVDNHLWYQQGLARAFATGFEVDFPVAAIWCLIIQPNELDAVLNL